jgi:hypothetical protein
MPEFTSTTASGYATNVQWGVSGGMRLITGHFSAPTAGSHYINTGLPGTLVYFHVRGADPDVYTMTADAAGNTRLHFSGLAVGATGNFFILGPH